MATHYLTIQDIEVNFGDHITKKELKKQTIGTSITVNDEQIVIIADQRFSKMAKEKN